MAASKAWFYLTGEGEAAQHHGPFDIEAMKKLFAESYLTEFALVWAEGEPEWLPLKASHDLYSTLAFQDDIKKEKKPDDEMLQFEAEIAAVEAGTAPEVGSPAADDREFEDDDGTKFVWHPALRKFVPEELVAAPVEYTPEMMTFVGSNEAVVTLEDARAEEEASAALAEKLHEAKGVEAAPGEKRNTPDATLSAHTASKASKQHEEGTGSGAGKAAAGGAAGEWFELKQTTSVYITGLPEEVTEEELGTEFARCGIIKNNDDGTPRIKLYRERESGALKGDALITFLQAPSVRLAITLMHGRQLRPGKGPAMTVQEAQFQMKQDGVSRAKGGGKGGSGKAGGQKGGVAKGGAKGWGGKGSGKGGVKGKKKGMSQAEKLLSWSGFDDTHKASEVTVLLSDLFTQEEASASPNLEAELTGYLLGRCKDLGAIDRVRVFKRSTKGTATIKFALPDAAQACIARLSATVMITRMFAPSACALEAGLEAEIKDDVLLKCREIEILPAQELTVTGEARHPVRVMKASSVGRVALACRSEADAAACADAIAGLPYAGCILDARAVPVHMWDGVTHPAAFGQETVNTAVDDQERLQAYAAELEGT